MKITYLGTTMLLFDDGEYQLLFDCHVTRPSMFTCMFKNIKPNLSIADKVMHDFNINRLKGIFISHSHHDHVLDMPHFATMTNCNVYGSFSTCNIALGNGVKKENVYCYDENSHYTIGKFNIDIIPSIHSKAHFYNNDLGQIINSPFTYPAKKKCFKEGGSVDFLIKHNNKKYLIRPSYNYIEGQLNTIQADVLFLGIAGLSKDTKQRQNKFFMETIDQVKPLKVIPIHWDHFFTPLYGKNKKMPKLFEDTDLSIQILKDYCKENDISFILQQPLTTIEI